jgi:hypothetical protein
LVTPESFFLTESGPPATARFPRPALIRQGFFLVFEPDGHIKSQTTKAGRFSRQNTFSGHVATTATFTEKTEIILGQRAGAVYKDSLRQKPGPPAHSSP